jgi:hypothetical protein
LKSRRRPGIRSCCLNLRPEPARLSLLGPVGLAPLFGARHPGGAYRPAMLGRWSSMQ